ncbi:MAG: TIGR03790 family protein [Opitutaceae bacterium]
MFPRLLRLLRAAGGWAPLALPGIAAPAPVPPPAPAPADVLVLANAHDPDSLALARHYLAARGVPAANLVALPLPPEETISRAQFTAQLWEPLTDWLRAQGWVDLLPMEGRDAAGRRRYAPQGHRIGALVLCRGVPLKVAPDAALLAAEATPKLRVEFRTNQAAVDAELSLIAWPVAPLVGFTPNPLFNRERPGPAELARVVRVARLDGPSAATARALVDSALAAERHGLAGRALVDQAQRGQVGDRWLATAARELSARDFEVLLDEAPATFPPAARADATALYFGWYSGTIDGPFHLPGFRFAPGAIALHIFSYSAATLRDPDNGWTGPLVARGVAATVGNVYEPYLELTHRPDLLLRRLLTGATWAEAIFHALPALGWQAVALGDPLYRPFARSLEEQVAAPSSLAAEGRSHAWLRRVRELLRMGRAAEAERLLERARDEAPDAGVAVWAARRELANGRPTAALAWLLGAPAGEGGGAAGWALRADHAGMLAAAGRPDAAVPRWAALLGEATLPAGLRRGWLPRAIEAATAAGAAAAAERWRAEWAALPPGN